MRLTASNLVKAIAKLPPNQWFEYVSNRSGTKVAVESITTPEGPIRIKRYNPSKGEKPSAAKTDTMSVQMLWRIANAVQENVPLNFDRVLGASYNTRSALEALLAHTPEFYWCIPGRIELMNSTSKIQRGHKHLVWLPENPHQNGIMVEHTVDQVISELPLNSAVYEALSIPSADLPSGMDIDVKRRHLQIQIALIKIGEQLGFRTWIAHNDKGFQYDGRSIGELNGVIRRLDDEKLMTAHSEAIKAAHLIDCIWFRNGRFLPAVIEVEHLTGVTSGLTRMKNLQDNIPPYPTRWVIVAPDEDREKVLREANKPQFQSLKAQFFPYSAVDELYALCQRRHLTNIAVNEEFLDCYMEPCLTNRAALPLH